MTTDTNNPAPIAEYACTWRTPDRTGYRTDEDEGHGVAREAFERAMAKAGYHLNPDVYRDGTYRDTEYRAGWEMWQAASDPAPTSKPAALDVSLDQSACELLFTMMHPSTPDDEYSEIRLQLGDGHSGYGLYVSAVEYPEDGAELVCAAPAPAADERAADSGHLAAAPKQQLPEPVARLLRWCGPSYMQVPHDGLAARTFAEFPLKESTSAHAYWKDGALLYTADQLHAAIAAERERNPWRMVMDDALVTAHLGVATDDPYDDLSRLLDWHHDIWLDPAVSSDAQALIDRGAAASEAELCTLRQQLAEAVRDGWSDADADAARLALELECLLTDKDVPMPALSRWWYSAHEALELHRARFRTAIAAQGEAK